MKERGPILVTGAMGFVGRWLLRDLLASGHRVFGLDLLPAGQAAPTTAGPFTLADPDPQLPGAFRYRADGSTWTFLPVSLEDQAAVADCLGRVRPGTVYHLAAQSSAARSFQDPHGTLAVNVTGTLNLLEGIRSLPETDRPLLLSIGSSEEYGPQEEDPQPYREDFPLRPISPYGVSKVAQTLLCVQYCRSFGIPIVATRSFSHTGPEQNPLFVFPSFSRQIAAIERGETDPVLKVGNLSPVRDYLDVRDVIRAYRLLTTAGRAGQIYNVSSGQPLTVRQGLEILLEGSPCQVEIQLDPDRQRPADIPYLVGDSNKLRCQTGWQPDRDIRTTLHELLDWARGDNS